MEIHDLLWEMTKKNNFWVRNLKYSWIVGEPWLPSIVSWYPVPPQEAIPYKKLLGAKVRNNWDTGMSTSRARLPDGTCSELVSWYIDYPENKPYLIILLEMASRLHDIHGKSTPITRALTTIDNYETH